MASQQISKSTQPFQVVPTVSKLREIRREAGSVGLVPTMGALHDGHLALIRHAARENTDVYVSVYVNPTQFGVKEDLGSYPRTWDTDKMKLEELQREFSQDSEIQGQIKVVFMPNTQEMYPRSPPNSEIDGTGSFVIITPLANRLEGASRPVFFRGVATVCMKLFNIVKPDKVYFGQKDIQQTFIIRSMVEDFHIDTTVRIGETTREPDGLAMSSRNVYLGERRRKVALVLLQALKAVQEAFSSGRRSRSELMDAASTVIKGAQQQQSLLAPSQRVQIEAEYISIASQKNMDELDRVNPEEGAIVSGAIRLLPLEESLESETLGVGGDKTVVRLIDNIFLGTRLDKI